MNVSRKKQNLYGCFVKFIRHLYYFNCYARRYKGTSNMVGLILVAQLEDGKIKWVLLGINYFFATYFHVVLLINEISWL